eukprot:CAMPEP_0113590680 /NCGR_PEP_ID=MMETSP0015_2-20120614/36817_1 /TAXON_ID=2838 /ORGANISM="Odontella" /LENGTH=53 /DNA_ID=CAMNT_0000496915 /DNA_START=29 /DNA_END=187 /DNA_ORIENTATION=- /assembly_acc=CAM_ASM_000160
MRFGTPSWLSLSYWSLHVLLRRLQSAFSLATPIAGSIAKGVPRSDELSTESNN